MDDTPTHPRILVVDDEENIRHMLSLLLRKEGYLVRAVPDAGSALEELARQDHDAVLCDVRMPGMSGLDFLRELSARKIAATVILMSAYGSIDTALEAIKAGAWDYIAKPFKKDDVLLTLRKAEERRRLLHENEALRRAARGADGLAGMVSRSPAMLRLFDAIRKIAEYRSIVLVTGESGTGKELVAKALHDLSPRRSGPLVTVNCGAIPEALLESELFGHVRGAFTDASRDKRGLFEEADGGTLLLDEVGELPLALQVKLLRVLQDSEIRRVGDAKSRRVDVRVVAATHRDLEALVREGRFREDLYYRLHVLPLRLPPLRERPEDVPLLADHFRIRFNEVLRTRVTGFSPQTMAILTSYAWPGNIRELENTVERAVVLSETEIVGADLLPEHLGRARSEVQAALDSGDLSIKRASRTIEAALIRRALDRTGGNRTAAARLLEISHRALLYKIKEYFPDGLP